MSSVVFIHFCLSNTFDINSVLWWHCLRLHCNFIQFKRIIPWLHWRLWILSFYPYQYQLWLVVTVPLDQLLEWHWLDVIDRVICEIWTNIPLEILQYSLLIVSIWYMFVWIIWWTVSPFPWIIQHSERYWPVQRLLQKLRLQITYLAISGANRLISDSSVRSYKTSRSTATGR